MKLIPRPEAIRLCRAINYHYRFAHQEHRNYWDKLMWQLLNSTKESYIASSNMMDGLLQYDDKVRILKKFKPQQRSG